MHLTTTYTEEILTELTISNTGEESVTTCVNSYNGYFFEKTQVIGHSFISMYEFILHKPITLSIQPNSTGVLMMFLLNGDQQFSHHLIKKVYNDSYTLELSPTDKITRYLSILISEEVIKKLELELLVNLQLNELPKQLRLDNLAKKNKVLSTEMISIITNIYSCQRNGSFRQAYLKRKANELLFLQLEYISKKPTISHISHTDIDRMYAARKLVTQNITYTYTLSTLAKEVGTNEFKLKKYFKELFGNTVFGYLNDYKMTTAKEKLQNSDLTISELAEKLGYKSQNHFSTVFRKYHGYPPSEIKKNKLQLAITNITDTIKLIPLFIIETIEAIECCVFGGFIA